VLGFVAAAVTAGYLLHNHRGTRAALPSNTSIAVLPFADMSPAKDQEYFSDGLAEQLISDLAKVPGLKVIGRSSAFQFRGSDEDARVVGRKLGVANILEGSVRRENSHVRITAELIEADDGVQLWSQTYDQEIKDIFAVQDEIAQSATAALQVKLLGSNSRPFVVGAPGANPEAYQAYLQAEYFRGRGQSKEDLSKALDYAGTAIKLDERYAPAWALRASVLETMAVLGMFATTEGFHRGREDAERAIELDPALGSAYLALASTQINYDWNWDAGEVSVNKATALEPGSAEVFRARSRLARASGNLDRAIKLDQEAVALDPLRANSHLTLGHLLFAAARYDEARAELKKALDLNPGAAYVHLTLGQIFLAEKKPQEALAEFGLEPADWGKLLGPAMAYHELGRKQASDAALGELIAKHGTGFAFQIAQVYAFRGQPDKSFEWLDRAYRQHDTGLVTIKTEPLFQSLHHDPRYTQLLARMRLN
jgi:TolB-like protein/tetratricopeptide (TPR) repeat protein